MNDLNTCDKCKDELNTDDLVWITADDFEYKAGEKLALKTFRKYDALCEDCYQSGLIK